MHARREESLRATYAAMDTEELEHRLASGQLVPLAAQVARVEFEIRQGLRERPAVPEPPGAPPRREISGGEMFFGAIIMGVVLYYLLPADMFFLALCATILPAIGAAIGKAFPALGLLMGGVMIATPIWLGVLMWHKGAFQGGADFKGLMPILAGIFLFLVSTAAMMLGHGLIKGARHEGSWNELSDELEEERKERVDGITGRD